MKCYDVISAEFCKFHLTNSTEHIHMYIFLSLCHYHCCHHHHTTTTPTTPTSSTSSTATTATIISRNTCVLLQAGSTFSWTSFLPPWYKTEHSHLCLFSHQTMLVTLCCWNCCSPRGGKYGLQGPKLPGSTGPRDTDSTETRWSL